MPGRLCDPIDIIEVLCERGLWNAPATKPGGTIAGVWTAIDARDVLIRHAQLRTETKCERCGSGTKAVDPRGTIAEAYLKGRGLVLPASMRGIRSFVIIRDVRRAATLRLRSLR